MSPEKSVVKTSVMKKKVCGLRDCTSIETRIYKVDSCWRGVLVARPSYCESNSQSHRDHHKNAGDEPKPEGQLLVTFAQVAYFTASDPFRHTVHIAFTVKYKQGREDCAQDEEFS